MYVWMSCYLNARRPLSLQAPKALSRPTPAQTHTSRHHLHLVASPMSDTQQGQPTSTGPIPTPTLLAQTEEDDSKPLTSGQIGAILATITVLVILSLAALHLLLSRRRRRARHSDDSSIASSEWSSRATRVRETVERVDVNWGPAGGTVGGGRGRRPPARHEIRAYERVVPVYGNVRHVRKPPATYFRG